MKVTILYRPHAEFATSVETFVRDYKVRHGASRLELVNVDEREGIALSSLYDITRFPAILALATDGTMLHMWQGEQLPLMDEVASYMYNV